MERVKQAFGLILLGTALWIVSPVIPVAFQMTGWALVLIIPAVLLRAVDPLPAHCGNGPRFWKGVGIVMLVCGAALLVGALSGATDPLQPLSGFRSGDKVGTTGKTGFLRIRTLAELDARIASAGKPVMLDFYADWCVSCKEMERDTFSDRAVQQRLGGWLLLQADVTAHSDEDKALLARFRLFGPPGIIFFDSSGKEIDNVRVIGYQKPEDFLRTLSALPY